jgi:hypothetical protein
MKLDTKHAATDRRGDFRKSGLVRKVLKDQIGRQREKKAHRAFDLVGNLCGSFNGPADLLTNPKQMQSFGR